MLKILKLIIIITFLLTIQIIKTDDKITNLSINKFNVVARALTNTLTLIFHEEKTVTIDYSSSTAENITNKPFKYLGTSYPLVYKYNNDNNQLMYYIVSITENSTNKFTFTVYESNKNSNANLTPFNIEFSQLNSLSSINENEFIASIINTNNKCDVIKCTLSNYSCDSLISNSESLCSNDNEILNVYYQPEINKYIYLHYSSNQMTSGIFNSLTNDYTSPQKTIPLNGDCNSISQLQTIQITENVILNCFMNTGNKKVCCSKGEYDEEKGEYNLNEFTADLSCQSNSFSMDKLDNDYILISCPGQQSNENPKYILYDKNKKIRGSGVITWTNSHYMRDFTITPNGDIYIIAYHNCGVFHQHKIIKENYTCSDFNYVIKHQDERLTQLNSITNDGTNIPSSIIIKNSNCVMFSEIQMVKLFKVVLQK